MAGSTSDIARWTNGAGTGNIATAGNWAVEAGTPSTPPAAGEVALLDYRANGDMTAGLTTYASTTLGELRINGYTGNIGGAGASMEVDATVLSVNSNGRIYLNGDFGTARIDSTGSGEVHITGGTTTTLNAQLGYVRVAAGAVATTVRNLGAGMAIEPNGTAITLFVGVGGTTTCERAITTETLDYGHRMSLVGASKTVTNLNIFGGAHHNHRTNGTVTNLNGYSGTFTPAGSGFAAVTVSNSSIVEGVFNYVLRTANTTVTDSSRTSLGFPPE